MGGLISGANAIPRPRILMRSPEVDQRHQHLPRLNSVVRCALQESDRTLGARRTSTAKTAMTFTALLSRIGSQPFDPSST